jgi:hypothetical protein
MSKAKVKKTAAGKGKTKVWLVTVNMGYGHQRASYPLRSIAYKGIITANDYPGMPQKDKDIFTSLETNYNALSKFKNFPILGKIVWDLFDKLQEIPDFVPGKDQSKPTFQVSGATMLIKNRKWGKHFIETLANERPDGKLLPYLTTFFSPAFFADLHGYPGKLFCILCDTDISRDWVAQDPKKSRLHYFAPTQRVVERLSCYGVPDERITYTGFPLPDENLGYPDFKILRTDTAARVVNLDPKSAYRNAYKKNILRDLKLPSLPSRTGRPLTIMYAVGGAGAQKEIGIEIASSFKEEIKAGKMKLILIAGVHAGIRDYFSDEIKKAGLGTSIGKTVVIMYEPDKMKYFEAFNKLLRVTDILWTKPSELSFYVALGIPLLMAPTIGSQEKFNRRWLMENGAGIEQPAGGTGNLRQWFLDTLESGRFAHAAMSGFRKAPRMGTYNILEAMKKASTAK